MNISTYSPYKKSSKTSSMSKQSSLDVTNDENVSINTPIYNSLHKSVLKTKLSSISQEITPIPSSLTINKFNTPDILQPSVNINTNVGMSVLKEKKVPFTPIRNNKLSASPSPFLLSNLNLSMKKAARETAFSVKPSPSMIIKISFLLIVVCIRQVSTPINKEIDIKSQLKTKYRDIRKEYIRDDINWEDRVKMLDQMTSIVEQFSELVNNDTCNINDFKISLLNEIRLCTDVFNKNIASKNPVLIRKLCSFLVSTMNKFMTYQCTEIFSILLPVLFTSMLSISSIDSLEFIIPAIKLMETTSSQEEMRDSSLLLILEFGDKYSINKKHEACQIAYCQVLETICLLSDSSFKSKESEEQISKWIASFLESPKLAIRTKGMQSYLALSNYCSLINEIKQNVSIKIKTNLSKIISVKTSEIKRKTDVSPKKRWSKSPESRMKKLVLFKMHSPSLVENEGVVAEDNETEETKSKIALSAEKREQRSIQFRKYRMERQSPSLKKHMNLFKTGRFSPILTEAETSGNLSSIESELISQSDTAGVVNLNKQFHADYEVSQTIKISSLDSVEYVEDKFCQDTTEIPYARLKDVVDGIDDSSIKVQNDKLILNSTPAVFKVVPFGTLAYDLICQQSDVAEIQTKYTNLMGTEDYIPYENDDEFAKVVRFRTLDYELIRQNTDIAEIRTKVEFSNMKYLTKIQTSSSKTLSTFKYFFNMLVQMALFPIKIFFGSARFSRVLRFASSCFLFLTIVCLVSLPGAPLMTNFEQVESIVNFSPVDVKVVSTIANQAESEISLSQESENFDSKILIQDINLETMEITIPETNLGMNVDSIFELPVELVVSEPFVEFETVVQSATVENAATKVELASEPVLDDAKVQYNIETSSTLETSTPLMLGLAGAVSMAFSVFAISKFLTPTVQDVPQDDQPLDLPEVENYSQVEEIESVDIESANMASRLSLSNQSEETVLGSFINPESLRITVVSEAKRVVTKTPVVRRSARINRSHN